MDKYIELEKLLDYIQPTKYIVSSEQYNDSFKTPVLTPGKTFILGYTDEIDGIYHASKEHPIILFDDFTTSIKWVDFDFKVKSSACKILVPKGDVDMKYVFYAMQKLDINTSSHKRYWISIYSKLKIYYPEKEERDLILDDLELINDAIEVNKRRIKLYEELMNKKMDEYFK